MNQTYTQIQITFQDGSEREFENAHLSIGAAWVVVSWETFRSDEGMPIWQRENHYPTASIKAIAAEIL